MIWSELFLFFGLECEAHIPPEMAFALGSQRKQNKQHEMYMPNVSPNSRGPNATYIPPVLLGLALGLLGLPWVNWPNARLSTYQHLGILNAKSLRHHNS